MIDENKNSDYLEYELLGDDEFPDEENGDAWEDASWDEDATSLAGSAVAVGELMNRLVHDDQLPAVAALRALSDLSSADSETVRTHWAGIRVERRREVVEALVQEAEVDVQLHLGRILRIALDDTDAQVRQVAIEGLWEDDSGDLVGVFTSMLRTDASTDVRAAAAAALGKFVLAGELDELDASLAMRAEESLLSVLRNDEEPVAVQSQALESIAYSGEVGVRELIEDAYYSAFEEMRVGALNAMGRSADIRWRGLAHAELTNPSVPMRVSAAIACGELEARTAVEDLVTLLNDEEQAVRLAAIFSLGRLGDRSAREALQEVAQSDLELEAQAAEDALEEMLFYGSADEIPLHDDSLESDDDSEDDLWDGWFGRDDSDLGTYE